MVFIRLGLFFLGYHYVRESGAPAPRSVAPVVVSNHSSFVETFYLTQKLSACGMSDKGIADIPILGAVLGAMEFVLVDKADPESRFKAAAAMRTQLASPKGSHFLAFAEGQTTNGTRLISFKDGAFRLGLAVQPAAVTYPAGRAELGRDEVRLG